MPLQSPTQIMNNPKFSDVSGHTRLGIVGAINIELYQSPLTPEQLSTGLRYLINQYDRTKKHKLPRAAISHIIACCPYGCTFNRTKEQPPSSTLLDELKQTQGLLQGKWPAGSKDNPKRVKAFVKFVVCAYLETQPEHVIDTQPCAPLIQNQVPIYSDENNAHPLFSKNSSRKQSISPTPTDNPTKTNT